MRVLRLSVRSVYDDVDFCLMTADRKPLAEASQPTNAKSIVPQVILAELSRYCKQVSTALHVEADTSLAKLDWESLEDLCGARVVVRGSGIVGRLPSRQLRVLICWSNPSTGDFPPLEHLESEVEAIANGLSAPECRQISIKELPHATSRSLQSRIRAWKPHVVHFVGHCKEGAIAPLLVMEDGKGGAEGLSIKELVSALAEAHTQVVVLSGCHTAELAIEIAREGRTAAIGIRDRVGDQYAYSWSRAFYAALGANATIEEALAQSRLAVLGFANDHRPLLASSLDSEPFSESTPRHNLPVFSRPFIGRVRQREELATKLLSSRRRLLTVHAMGGMGKTRLACQVGVDLLRRFPDGVWFIECDAVTSGQELLSTLASTVGVPAVSSVRDLIDFFGDSEVLLIVDCFEKLVDEITHLQQLVAGCSNVRVLVTSRVIPCETEDYSLLPMSIRKRGARAEGLALLESSINHIQPEFRLTRENRPTCQRIVEILEGVPLAIVLVAGRVRHYPIDELLAKLEESILDATRQTTGKPHRHASLRIVIADSLGLLSNESIEVAMKASVFAGGFDMADAKFVMSDVADLESRLFELCDHAILMLSGRGNEARFRCLDSIREYLTEETHRIDIEPYRQRHAARFFEKGNIVRKEFDEGKTAEAVSALLTDSRNFRDAWRWTIKNDRIDRQSAFAFALARPLMEAGFRNDFIEIGTYGEQLARNVGDADLLSEIIGLLGSQYCRDGDHGKACRYWNEKIQYCLKKREFFEAADLCIDLGLMSVRSGAFESGLENIAAFRKIQYDLGQHPIITDSFALEAHLQAESGSDEQSWASISEARKLFNQQGANTEMLYFMEIGAALQVLGDFKESLAEALEMLRSTLKAKYISPIAQATLQIARAMWGMGEHTNAIASLEITLRMPRQASLRIFKEAREFSRQIEIPNIQKPLPPDRFIDFSRDLFTKLWSE